MTGAINYVRREERYVMKYYLVASNMEELEFLSSLSPFADIALFLLNCKKRQCDKYYNGVPNSKMSDVKNIYFVHSLFQTYNPT